MMTAHAPQLIADGGAVRHGTIDRWVLATLIWLLSAWPLISSFGSPHAFGAEYDAELARGPSAHAAAIARVVNLATLATALLAVAARGKRIPRRGASAMLAALAFCAGPLLSSVFGTVPQFFTPTVVIPLVLIAVFLLRPVPLEWVVRHIEAAILVQAFGTLAAVLLVPDWAIEWNYRAGLLSQFDWRLHGLPRHANVLGAFLVTYLIVRRPAGGSVGSRFFRVVSTCVVIGELVATQSKTAFGALVVGASIRLAFRLLAMPRRKRALSLLGLALVSVVAVALLVVGGSPSRFGSADDSITTLTGRTAIWAATIALWAPNPLFGYGPGLWRGEMRFSHTAEIGFVVPHAHNQFIQTLGESGIVGVLGLAAYTFMLLHLAWRTAPRTRGVSLALVAMLMVRGITEPPFRSVITDGNFFLHVATWAFLLVALRSADVDPSRAAASAGRP